MAELKVGDKVLYSPDLIHAAGSFRAYYADGEHKHLFHYVHVAEPDGAPGAPKSAQVGRPANLGEVGQFKSFDAKTGILRTHGGHVIKVAGPVMHWPAEVVRVNADGTCDLEIKHPNGFAVFRCPDRTPYQGPLPPPANHLLPEDRPGVRYDKKKAPHTFHLEGD